MKIKNPFICIILVTIVVFASFPINASWNFVQHEFCPSGAAYTAITNTQGYYEAYFTGRYYTDGSGTDTATLSGVATGGGKTSFLTTLYLSFYGTTVSKTSQVWGRDIHDSITHNSSGFPFGTSATGAMSSTSKTNSADYWSRSYTNYWSDCQYGWYNM
jgi:hypothetical protein